MVFLPMLKSLRLATRDFTYEIKVIPVIFIDFCKVLFLRKAFGKDFSNYTFIPLKSRSLKIFQKGKGKLRSFTAGNLNFQLPVEHLKTEKGIEKQLLLKLKNQF